MAEPGRLLSLSVIALDEEHRLLYNLICRIFVFFVLHDSTDITYQNPNRYAINVVKFCGPMKVI